MNATRAATFSLCVLGGLFSLGIIVYAGQGWRQGADWWLSFICLGLWSLSPYAGLAACGLWGNRTKRQALITLIGSILVPCFGVLLLVDGFFLHPDAQNALVLIFLPLYQLAGVGVLFVVIWVVGRRVS